MCLRPDFAFLEEILHQMKRCLEQARDGDARAREALVRALRPRLTKMAAYYARCSGEDRDDLVQEAWLGLLEALPVVDLGIGSPEQYLIQCARWRLLDAIRRARVRRCEQVREEPIDRTCGFAPEAGVASACVSEFVGQLSRTQRAVLRCLLSGFTWREAGRMLGCSSANIAYHVRRIRRIYQEWMLRDV